ncbi:high affinity methionine permease [Coniochaeta sp. PMI_546]|nr:high affinity methionine permease [Coniochaeta sp. PMI_546]
MGWLDIKEQLTLRRGAARSGEALSSPSSSDPARTPTAEKDSDIDATVIHQPIQPGELTLEESANGGLGRHLGLFSTTFLIVGRIIGTGIFSTPSSITAGVGSVGAALMLWVLGLVLSYCGLMVWLEFGCMYPRSGGEKVYLEAVYRRPRFLATIVFAVQAILLGFTASGCIVFASNIVVASGRNPGEWEERGIAIAVIVFVTCVHTFMPKAGVWLMNVIGSIKVIILLYIVITGWVVLGGGVKSVPDPHASFRNSFAGSATSGNLYASALFKVLNSYAGWSNAAYVLNEVKRPVRTLKIAGPLGLGICSVLYLLANVAYFSAATPKEIAGSGVTVASYFVGKVFGNTARRVLSVFVALSALGNVLTITFAQSRVNQELAKEGVIPFGRFWAGTWPAGAPSAGLLLHFIPSFIVIVAIPFGDAFNFIVDVEGYPSSVLSALVVIGLFILRWQFPEAPRPFKVWWPVAGFFLAGQLFLIVAPFLYPPNGKGDTSLPYWLYPIIGIVVLVSGVVYWFLWRKVLPKIGKYELVERKERLDDGTVVATFDKVKQ